MGERMQVASGIGVVHLAGATDDLPDSPDGGTIELGNDAGRVAIGVATGGPGEGTSISISPVAGTARLDGAEVRSFVAWPPGSVLRIGADAWRLETDDVTALPLADDRPLRARRVPVVEPSPEGALGRLLHRGRRRRHDAERTAELSAAAERLERDLEDRQRRLTTRARARRPAGREAVIGIGDLVWRPEVVSGPHTGWDPSEHVSTPRTLPSVPIVVDLERGPLAVVVDSPQGQDLVRALVLQLSERGGVGAVVGPATSTWRWMAALDTFTSRPAEHDRSDLLVVTELTGGSHGGPTIVVVPERAMLATTPHVAVVELDADGLGTVTGTNGEVLATAVCPMLRPVADVLGRPDAIDAGPERGMVAFRAPRLDDANELLASLVIDLAKRCEPSELAVFVIDEVRRPLVRLRQIPHLRDYVSLDDLDGVADVVARVEALEGVDRVVLAIADLPEVDLHLRHRGREETFRRLVRLAAATDHRHLTVAASSSSDARLHGTLGAATGPKVQRVNGHAIVADDRGRRTIALSRPSARDLTGAVAGLRVAAERR